MYFVIATVTVVCILLFTEVILLLLKGGVFNLFKLTLYSIADKK